MGYGNFGWSLSSDLGENPSSVEGSSSSQRHSFSKVWRSGILPDSILERVGALVPMFRSGSSEAATPSLFTDNGAQILQRDLSHGRPCK